MNRSELFTILLHTLWLCPVGHVTAGGTDYTVLLWDRFRFLSSHFGSLSCCLNSSHGFFPYLLKNQVPIQLRLSQEEQPEFGVWGSRRASRSWSSQGNPRATDKDKAQVLVSIHFLKTVSFSKTSFHSDRELWHHCEGPKSLVRVLARNSAAWPAPEQPAHGPCCDHSGVLLHTPSLPTSHTFSCPWAVLPLCTTALFSCR